MRPDPISAAGLDRPIVVYDGSCAYCRAQVERIRRLAPEGTFEYLPRQTEGLDTRFPRLAEDGLDAGMRLIDRDGVITVGADAVHEVVRRLPRWRRLAWLYRVPGLGFLSRVAYGWIARNRHRLGGACTSDACGDVPEP